MKLFTNIIGTRNDRELKQLAGKVRKINDLESSIKSLSDTDLASKTVSFKERYDNGESLDSILPEAFAVVREAAQRTLGMRHFDVQLIGGLVLHSGRIAEMKTGEGKTLTATLPVYLNALTGKGVHVVTVNDYLAGRDAEWMAEVYGFLGLSTSCALSGQSSEERIKAYRADITYGQNNEFGFDYLRDNMKLEISDRAQRGHHFAIIDEVDSILIDEARTPLIISGPSEKPAETYKLADRLVRKLKNEVDFIVDIKDKQVTLTDQGMQSIEQMLNIDNLYDPQNIDTLHHVQQALRAHVIQKRDIDYVVRGGEIIIVDEFTGRLMAGRRWSNGLHQAVEAKEGVAIQRENQTLATITFQNYFRKYEKLSGMTGTADTEAVEFKKIYDLDVVVVPTNEPMIRDDRPDIIYITEQNKFHAVIDEIKSCKLKGQPVLVGTGSIEKSEVLSSLLKKQDIVHTVLNAKQHEREAEIVAQAGRLGAVTISTNMAGRGTDILLGGNPEVLTADSIAEDATEEEYEAELEKAREFCASQKQEVLSLGGLHIIGTERHESRRIDNQLRGRSGRQGDPGSSRFFISLEDDLMRRFGGERLQAMMLKIAGDEDPGVEGGIVSKAIERAQRKVEAHHFDIRKHLLEYDDVLTKQRDVVYGLREKILRGGLEKEELVDTLDDVLEQLILASIPQHASADEDQVEQVCESLKRQVGVEVDKEQYIQMSSNGDKEIAQVLFDDVRTQVQDLLTSRENQISSERFFHLIQVVYLQAIDHFWKEHLTFMDQLREGIGLQQLGQKNPLHEYQRQGYLAFGSMLQSIKLSLAQHLLLMPLPTEQELIEIEEQEKEALRQREEAASAIHEDTNPSASEDEDDSSLNRKQRRSQSKDKQGGALNYESAEARAKKNKARRKSKQAKKSKRKAR